MGYLHKQKEGIWSKSLLNILFEYIDHITFVLLTRMGCYIGISCTCVGFTKFVGYIMQNDKPAKHRTYQWKGPLIWCGERDIF